MRVFGKSLTADTACARACVGSLAIGLAVLGISTPAAAVQQTRAGTSINAPSDGPRTTDPSRRVCRSIRPTGSRLSTRQCRTQAQWDELREETRQFVQDGQTNGSRRNEGLGPGL